MPWGLGRPLPPAPPLGLRLGRSLPRRPGLLGRALSALRSLGRGLLLPVGAQGAELSQAGGAGGPLGAPGLGVQRLALWGRPGVGRKGLALARGRWRLLRSTLRSWSLLGEGARMNPGILTCRYLGSGE